MGLFTPTISKAELASVKNMLKQVNESAKTVNTTTNPETFFGRLNFIFDLLLELKKYEKYRIFTGNSPTKDYNYLLDNLESSVNAFIDRTFEKQKEKMSTLKTDKAKYNSFQKYALKMRTAFENANNYWQGNTGISHYTGVLYTQNNVQHLNKVLEYGDNLSGSTNASTVKCPNKSKTDELSQYKKLLNDGIITAEEYETIKSKLLR